MLELAIVTPPVPPSRATGLRMMVTLIAALLTGCGGQSATVSGVVTLDGKPLERGRVGFTPTAGGMRAVSEIHSDGSYEVSTNREEGLAPGEYSVSVVSREPGVRDPNSSGPPAPGPYITPEHYSVESTSGLKYTVESGSNTINIELSSDGGASEAGK